MAPWVGVGGICLAVGREWENFMALSLHEPEITLSLFIFVSFVLRWEESGRTSPFILKNEAECVICNEEFPNRSLLKEHTQSCPICEKTFNDYPNCLTNHIQHNHEQYTAVLKGKGEGSL